MTGGALNLSLLSRGVGEVHKNGHEKVEVFLEPEDYYNFSKNPNKFYLPPLSSNYPSFINASPTISTRSPRESKEFRVPKTFTTRKGALLLFSEDLAQRNMERAAAARRRAASQAQTSHSLTPASSVDPQIYLKTVEDLAQSILKYGSHDRPDDKVYLKFVHARRDNFERQIRPGYSAKRYLSTWTRNWDDTVFGNVIKKGYITERSLYHYNLVVPNLRRRLFYEDLSHMPQPYRLMRNMLMMPGSLSGYTFYRAPTQFLEEDDFDDHDSEVLGQRSDRLHNIRVIKTQGGVQEEVAYSDLDRQSQKDVITDLLVKSAVHYALKKQEEMYEESIIMAVHSQQQGGIEHPGVTQQEFDMRDAVESLLDSHHGRYAIGADLPEIDNKSHHSDLTGSFKGAPVPPHAVKQHAPYHRQSWPAEAGAESEKEYMGGVPVVAFKESGSTASESSSVPHLPPIRHALSPIRDVSRETTQHNLSLPPIGKVFRRTISTQYSDSDTISTDPPTVNVQPATPQHSSLTAAALSSHDVAGASTEAARGLYSRDTDALLEEDEAESASAEAETDPDRKLRKKGDMSNSSIQSSEKGKDRKASTSDVAGPQSSVDSAAHAPLSTTTSGTTKLRPQWKAGAQSLRKGLSPEEHETLGVLFCPPTQPHPPALFLSMQGHAPLSSSLPRSHDDDLSPHHSPFSSGPSSVHSGHKPGPSSHRPSHSSHPSSHQSTNNSPHPSSHQTNNSPHPSSHQTNNSAHPSLHQTNNSAHPSSHQTNNSAHPSPHQSMNNSPRPSAHLAPLSSGPPSHASWAWDRDGYPKRPHKTSKPGSVVESAKGSMIMAPDGEIISVGGSVVRGGASHDVGDMSDVLAARHQLQAETAGTDESGQSDEEPDEWKATKKFSISQRSESNKKMHKRGSATSSSVSKEDLEKLSTTGKQLLIEQASKVSDSVSRKSSVTEKDIMDTLTEHAQRIAESVLSQPASGQNLEKDVQDAIAEIMRNRRASSAAPSAAEYRDLIKKSLATAAAKAAGIDPETLPDEAEISEELLEALANHKLSPDQIEVVSDSEGRTRIQSRVDLTEALGGVEEGHIFIAPGSKAEESGIGKRQISIPADRTSQMDDMEFDRISYQGTDVMSEKGEKGKSKSRGGSKAGSIAGGTLADLSEMEGVMAALEGKVENAPEPEDDFMKAVAEAAGTATKDTPPDTVRKTTSGKTTPSAVSVKATLPVEEKTPPAAAADDAASEKSRPSLPGGTATEKKAEDMQSVKSGKTGVSQKSEASKDSKKKGKKSPEEKDEPFVVGKVDQKGELEKLYGPVDLPPPPPPAKQEEKGAMDHVAELQKLYGGKVPTAGGAPPKLGSAKGKPKEKKAKKELTIPKKEEKKKKGKKGKKGKKKEEEEPAPPAPAPVEEAPPPPPPPPAAPEKELTPRPVSSEHKPSSPDERTEDESDYEIVREQSSPELDHGPKTRLNLPSPPPDEEEDKSDGENEDEEGEDMNLKSISNREARAAKRAAAAAKRREEVERRRREKEEQAKREKEEVERQVALQREMEEERRRREEERRMRKEQQREQEERERREQEETEKRKRLDADRERKAKEEYQRKLEEVKRKQHEEELRKHELMLQRQREEEERRLAEEEMLSQMAEQERLEYERKKKEEEEERKRKELEDKLRRAEEARKAMEEAQRLAEEMARKQAELEARLKFNRALQEEANGLSHSQEINRAFVYSYFDLLKWLGLDIPEFELAKLADY